MTRRHHPRTSPSTPQPGAVDRRTWLVGAGAMAGVLGCQPNGRGTSKRSSPKANGRASLAGARAIHQRNVGFQLGHEQFTLPELVELGVMAEDAGFDIVTASDHLQPWQANQGHSGCARSPSARVAFGSAPP